MTPTLDAVNAKKKPDSSAEAAAAAAELVRMTKEKGWSLTGPDGLGKQLTNTVLETMLSQEMTVSVTNLTALARNSGVHFLQLSRLEYPACVTCGHAGACRAKSVNPNHYPRRRGDDPFNR